MVQKEFKQIFPKSGWVEHDANEILKSQMSILSQLLKEQKVNAQEVKATGITNQRETTIVWDKTTGKPVYNAIVWRDKQTADICKHITKSGLTKYMRKTTGLVIDSYFSGTKVKWFLDNDEGAKAKAENGDLLIGTVDSWLFWNMTNGTNHFVGNQDYTDPIDFIGRTFEYWYEKMQLKNND